MGRTGMERVPRIPGGEKIRAAAWIGLANAAAGLVIIAAACLAAAVMTVTSGTSQAAQVQQVRH